MIDHADLVDITDAVARLKHRAAALEMALDGAGLAGAEGAAVAQIAEDVRQGLNRLSRALAARLAAQQKEEADEPAC